MTGHDFHTPLLWCKRPHIPYAYWNTQTLSLCFLWLNWVSCSIKVILWYLFYNPLRVCISAHLMSITSPSQFNVKQRHRQASTLWWPICLHFGSWVKVAGSLAPCATFFKLIYEGNNMPCRSLWRNDYKIQQSFKSFPTSSRSLTWKFDFDLQAGFFFPQHNRRVTVFLNLSFSCLSQNVEYFVIHTYRLIKNLWLQQRKYITPKYI